MSREIFFLHESNRSFADGRTKFPVNWGEKAGQHGFCAFVFSFVVAVLLINIWGPSGAWMVVLTPCVGFAAYAQQLFVSSRLKENGDGDFVEASVAHIEWFSPWDDNITCKVAATFVYQGQETKISGYGTNSHDNYKEGQHCLVWTLSRHELYLL